MNRVLSIVSRLWKGSPSDRQAIAAAFARRMMVIRFGQRVMVALAVLVVLSSSDVRNAIC